MKRLEHITGESCTEQVIALASKYPTEQQEHCKVCRDYNQSCYKPVKVSQISIRRGSYAVLT